MADERLDAVLPLTAADAERADILFASLERLFEPLGTGFAVAPDDDVNAIEPRLPQGWIAVPESEVVPEIAWFRATARLRATLRVVGPPFHGWFVQQLIKLAIAERVTTRFYLTLDADVICVRPTRYDDLVPDGRAVVQTARPNHPEWNDDAERVLALPRSGRQHAVTPALLARDAVRDLAAHLERRVDPRLRRLAERVPPGRARDVLASWRSFLLRSLPWTEYALYHTFLERTGRFDRFHVLGREDAIYGNNVWTEDEFEEWQPTAAGPFHFSVVQSAARIAPARVRAKVDAAATAVAA